MHLSSRWINSYYKEKDLINLISILEKKFKIILTSDNSTKKKFFLIFDKFNKIKNKNFIHFKFIEKTTILDNLNFLNWTQAIYSANLVITPECGCTHVAALCKIPSRIIYNPLNKPKAIQNEYAPWHSIYEKYTFDEENLNLKLSKNL